MTAHPERERSLHRAHAVIREFVRSASSAAGEDPPALVRLLRHTLPAHFAYEEREGGFFARLEQRGASALLLDRLRADHREFLARLDGLDAAMAKDQDLTAELAGIAERLREHEWIESASAAQLGLHSPTDPESEPDLAGRALSAEVTRGVDRLVLEVRALAERHGAELLASITVGVPDTVQNDEALRAVVDEELARQGLDFIEVVLRSGDGTVELLDARFRRLR